MENLNNLVSPKEWVPHEIQTILIMLPKVSIGPPSGRSTLK